MTGDNVGERAGKGPRGFIHRDVIRAGQTALGIELGSTRIKACLVDADDPSVVLATGSHAWENRWENGNWTYGLDEVWGGLRSAYADLVANVERRHGVTPVTYRALGVSAMMHGYLAFNANGELLVPFRTWRNTTTGRAAAALTEAFGVNIPLRWSIAHLYQAVLDEEPHVDHLDHISTLAGYIHEQLTGQRVLGICDASGMFPITLDGGTYDAALLDRFDALVADRAPALSAHQILPRVLTAGQPAGALTEVGAWLLDPTGTLRAGVPLCPPEGDAGTGMVATGAVAPRTGNVSVGTSVFAMVVLERSIAGIRHEIDLVTTPAGDPVAMVHCNNGASELSAWAGMFSRFADAAGNPLGIDEVFRVLLEESLAGEPDAGGLVAYNHLSGEPIAGLDEGRPMFVRTPDSRFTLANAMRAQVYGIFATLALGMRVLETEGVEIDRIFGHGGVFRTAGVAQRFLASALTTPVAVGETAAEGGPWGIAVLASYLGHAGEALHRYLDNHVFAQAKPITVTPDTADVVGFTRYLKRYHDGLVAERTAADVL